MNWFKTDDTDLERDQCERVKPVTSTFGMVLGLELGYITGIWAEIYILLVPRMNILCVMPCTESVKM